MDKKAEVKFKGKFSEVIETSTKRWIIFDAPGQNTFELNLIMGVCRHDLGALIISAKKGEFEAGFEMGGLIKEHIKKVKNWGIKKLVVVVNKMDEPSV